MTRFLRRIAFGVFFVTLSGCCCCDPEALQKYSEAAGMQDEIEAKMKEEMAKAQAQQAEAQAKVAEAQAKQAQVQAEAAKPKPTLTPPPEKVAPTDIAGKFKDNALDKDKLTGGSLKLEVDAGTKKVTGRFLGQYHRKPFSLPLEGKLKADDTFELKGKDADKSDVTVAGKHGGEALSGKITGMVKGKAIAADFDAKRY